MKKYFGFLGWAFQAAAAVAIHSGVYLPVAGALAAVGSAILHYAPAPGSLPKIPATPAK